MLFYKVRLVKTCKIDNTGIHKVYYSIPKSIYLRFRQRLNSYTFRKHINKLIKKGYIKDDGTPLKCTKCKSTDLTDYGHIYEDYYCVEYYVKCKHCNSQQGTWSYGSWIL